ncbi:MAG: replication initiation protein [Campylobacter sp.]|nr:replication initiation protein [Campylobacter sp.]
MEKELKKGFTRNQSHTSHAITYAKSKMKINELKAFYQATTLIDKNDDEFHTYAISVNDFVKNLGFTETNGDYVKELCRHLAKQTFEIEQGDIWEIYPIFSAFKFDMKKQLITINFNEQMRPYLLQLQGNFTQIKEIKYIREFESKYAIRIYAMLKDSRLINPLEIEVEKLVEILQLPKSYSNFDFINKKVLQVAKKEINEKSDLIITKIEPTEKQRKKIIKIAIHFKTKEPLKENQEQTKKARETKQFNKYIGKEILYLGNFFKIDRFLKVENNQIQFVGTYENGETRLDFDSLAHIERYIREAKERRAEMKLNPDKFIKKDHSEAMQNLFAKFAKN